MCHAYGARKVRRCPQPLRAGLTTGGPPALGFGDHVGCNRSESGFGRGHAGHSSMDCENSDPELSAGAFGAVGVREARAGAVIVGGRSGAWFGASGGPPAGSVAGQFADFRTAQFRF